MRIILSICSCLMMVACAVMTIKLIKEKKPNTTPYLILSIITFLIALLMFCNMLGN